MDVAENQDSTSDRREVGAQVSRSDFQTESYI